MGQPHNMSALERPTTYILVYEPGGNSLWCKIECCYGGNRRGSEETGPNSNDYKTIITLAK